MFVGVGQATLLNQCLHPPEMDWALNKKEMAASAEDIGAKEQVHFITRPPTAIRETLNWGRKSLDVIKRRLHSEKMYLYTMMQTMMK